jgi:hypothetical protein
MADKKKISRNNTMYNTKTYQVKANNTYHSNLSTRNYKEFGMHPLTYHSNAVHNLKPFLESAKKKRQDGNLKVFQPDNSIHIPNASTVSQLLPNCQPDLSKIRYNNITKAVTNETIAEYALTVNSHDRNFKFYENPYSYTIRFNPMDKSIIKQVDGTYKTIPGDPKPHIKSTFNHIRYFKLELTILPTKLYNVIKITDTTNLTDFQTGLTTNALNLVDNQELSSDGQNIKIIHIERDGNNFDVEFSLGNANECYNWSKSNGGNIIKYKYTKTEIKDITKKLPFVTININEINDANEYSTSDTINKCFNTLYVYQTRDEYSNFHTANVDKIFRFSELGNIKKLTINFTDHLGNIFKIDNLNTSNWVKNIPTDEVINGVTSLKSPSLYIRHPLHGTYQNHILFKIGTIENEIDKNVYC